MKNNDNLIPFPASQDKRLEVLLSRIDKANLVNILNEIIGLIDEGCDDANLYAGLIYEFGGEDFNKDPEKAKFYFERAIETRGSTEAYLGLGRIYYKGYGGARNYGKALEVYEIVDRESRHPVAALMLGKIYERGNGVSVSIEKARKYYKKSIRNGSIFGITYLGLLEQKNKHYFLGTILRLIAGLKGFFIIMKNERDIKLRTE